MKHLLLLLLSISITFTTFAQFDSAPLPNDYIAVGTGINATGLIGLTYEHVFKEHIGAYVNVGFSSWGSKLGLGGRFYFKNVNSGAIGINLSHATGANGVKSNLSVVEKGQTVTKEITYNAHAMDVLNLSYLKFWKLGERARFNLEVGYSVPFQGKGSQNYTIVTPGVVLDATSEKALNIVQPGGLILAIGFSFGF